MTGQKDYIESVNAHYTPGDLAANVLNILKANGKDLDNLIPDDFALVDQLHTGGKGATLELAKIAGLKPDMEVLDVGGGIGGTARILASHYDCLVTVLDLTESFIEVGKQFTHLTKLDAKIRFELGNALQMPFADSSFDRVITQHSTMNIPDKPKLYSEVYRVLRSGGRFVFHEIMAGPNSPIYFPVPWARESDISFLLQPQETLDLLTGLGFKERIWMEDEIGETMERASGRFSVPSGQPGATPQLGMHLLFKQDMQPIFANVARNYAEGRLTRYWGVFEK